MRVLLTGGPMDDQEVDAYHLEDDHHVLIPRWQIVDDAWIYELVAMQQTDLAVRLDMEKRGIHAIYTYKGPA